MSTRKAGLADTLVGAALTLLARGGAEAVSLRAVARSAGVSAMAPYRHFPDKEALLAAVATRGFTALQDALRDADSAPGDKLVAQAVAYVSFALANPALFRLMFGPPRSGKHAVLDAANDSAFAVLTARVAAEMPVEARESLTLGCWGLVHGLALLFLDCKLTADGSPAEVTRRVAQAMLGRTAAAGNGIEAGRRWS